MLSAVYATAIPSVRPSVTRVPYIKTAECIIIILSLSDRPIILVFFVTKGCCVNLMASPPKGVAGQIQGVAIFDQYAAISKTRNR